MNQATIKNKLVYSPTEETQLEKILDKEVPKSARIIYSILKENDGITPKELLDKVDISPRTVRYAVRNLEKKHFVRRLPNLYDMRQQRIFVTPIEEVLDMYNKIEGGRAI